MTSTAFDPVFFSQQLRDRFIAVAKPFMQTECIESAGLILDRQRGYMMLFTLAIAGVKMEEGLRELARFAPADFTWPAYPPRHVLEKLTSIKMSAGWTTKPPRGDPAVHTFDEHGLRPTATCHLIWQKGFEGSIRPDVLLLERTIGYWATDFLLPQCQWAYAAAVAAPDTYSILLKAQRYTLKQYINYEDQPLWWA